MGHEVLSSYTTGPSLPDRRIIARFTSEMFSLSLSWQERRQTKAFLNIFPDRACRARLKEVLKAATGLMMYALHFSQYMTGGACWCFYAQSEQDVIGQKTHKHHKNEDNDVVHRPPRGTAGLQSLK